MNTNTTNEGVMNNNTQPQNELFQILKEIERLRFERGKINSELTTKIKDLENKKNEVQINLFPIKMGDEVITKQMYKIFKINKKGKTDRSISYEMVDKDFLKGKVFHIFINSNDSCEIGVHFDLEDDGYTTDLLLENDGVGETPKIVSLDRFNELYEVVKN
jgi:hypothetical protein